MRILDFAWNALTSVSGADHFGVRLLLDEELPQPLLGRDSNGYVFKLPTPKRERDGLYSLQGLYAESDDQNWTVLWRLFRASLYHSAFHLLHSDLGCYMPWAKGRDRYAASFAISLVEDYKITLMAQGDWRPLLPDIAFANLTAAMRMGDPGRFQGAALRAAVRLLLQVWGVANPDQGGTDDRKAARAGNKVRSLVQKYAFRESGKESLLEAAELAYRAVDGEGLLPLVPSFPHTEAHALGKLFESKVTEDQSEGDRRLALAYEALGVDSEKDAIAPHILEARDALQAVTGQDAWLSKTSSTYSSLISGTKLKGVDVPRGDYGTFMRTRSELAGSIRNVRDQLMQVRNVLDDNQGEESGQIDMTAAMQVIASKQARSDIFVREQLLGKDEAWAILVDASKSIGQVSTQLRGITTCLAEVAKDLMREKSRWGVFAFNDAFQVVKEFDESYSIDAKARIGGLVQEGPTYLPDALTAASRALNSRPIDSKYLVVVSDCLPTGYEGIETELEARIKTIARSGVMLLGVGVQSSAVRKYFKVNCVMTSPYELMKFFVKAYLELSATAG